MKIFFVPGAYDGCYYYRGYLPAIYGEMSCVTNFSGGHWDIDEIRRECERADVLVFQRPNDNTRVELMRLFQQKGKFIVFENDDTYLPDKGVPLNMLGSDKAKDIAIQLSKNIERALKTADLIIASTPLLANEYRLFTQKPIIVRHNTVDPLDEWPRKRLHGDKLRVGFVGSVSSNNDWLHVADTIRKMDDSGLYQIVVLGNYRGQRGYEKDEEFWYTLKNLEWHTFVPVTRYYKKIADMQLDVAMIPRSDNYFNRCKSNIKFLEMSLLKIPVVAQGFSTNDSPYQGKQDKKYMTVVTKNEDWWETMEDVRNDYNKYATLAESAHDYVVENYNIEKYAKKWRQIIEQYANRT